jgi:threonine synthase
MIGRISAVTVAVIASPGNTGGAVFAASWAREGLIFPKKKKKEKKRKAFAGTRIVCRIFVSV